MPSFPSRTAPGSGAAAHRALSELVRLADATRIGGDIWADVDGALTPTIPVPAAAPMTLSAVDNLLIWDTGLTVADVVSLTARLEVTLPATVGIQALLPFGFLFSAEDIEDVDATEIAAAKNRWSSAYAGSNGATAGTTVATSAQNNNLDPKFGAVSQASATHLVCQVGIIDRSTTFEADSYSLVIGASPSRSNNTNGDDLAGTLRIYLFLGADLGRTTGNAVAPTVELGWTYAPA